MKVFLFNTAKEAQAAVADQLYSQIASAPASVLGLATGETMEQVYENLVALVTEHGISMRQCRTFNLDEYVGIPPSHPNSYRSYMREHFFRFVDLPERNQHIPDSSVPAVEAIQQYRDLLRAYGPIDFQLLGIGKNGHIGFNEPGTSFEADTQLAKLSKTTISANSRFFTSVEEMPTTAITMGVHSILQAKRIVLLATGAAKSTAVHNMTCGPVTEDCPASALQMHGNVDLFLDTAAAAALPPSIRTGFEKSGAMRFTHENPIQKTGLGTP